MVKCAVNSYARAQYVCLTSLAQERLASCLATWSLALRPHCSQHSMKPAGRKTYAGMKYSNHLEMKGLTVVEKAFTRECQSALDLEGLHCWEPVSSAQEEHTAELGKQGAAYRDCVAAAWTQGPPRGQACYRDACAPARGSAVAMGSLAGTQGAQGLGACAETSSMCLPVLQGRFVRPVATLRLLPAGFTTPQKVPMRAYKHRQHVVQKTQTGWSWKSVLRVRSPPMVWRACLKAHHTAASQTGAVQCL